MRNKILVKDGKIVATHDTWQDIEEDYPDCDCYVVNLNDYKVEDVDSFGNKITRSLKSGDDFSTIPAEDLTTSEDYAVAKYNTLMSRVSIPSKLIK